jgi:hypothetical protein
MIQVKILSLLLTLLKKDKKRNKLHIREYPRHPKD